MASQPLFSIVTVTLNSAQDALATAQSVLAQNFQDYEYIIKDGGSTDGTVKKLRELGLSVFVKKDDGIYQAMNQALELCRGEYVCFLNAGDVFIDNKVLRRSSEMIHRKDDVDIYYGDVVMSIPHPYADPKEHRRLRRLTLYPPRLGKFFLYRSGLCHQAWLVRKGLYSKHPFDVGLKVMADYDFLLDQIFREKAKIIHLPLLMVEYKGMGRSELHLDEWLEDRRQVVRKYFSPVERLLYEGMRLCGKSVIKAAYRMHLFETAGENC